MKKYKGFNMHVLIKSNQGTIIDQKLLYIPQLIKKANTDKMCIS